MNNGLGVLVAIALLGFTGDAASKPHVIAFGKWTTVSWRGSRNGSKPVDLKIRSLYVDGHAREFTTGATHDVTDRTFVLQRIYRVNDSLPQEAGPPQWRWQLGGWLLVDRASGKLQPLALPEFDPGFSN